MLIVFVAGCLLRGVVCRSWYVYCCRLLCVGVYCVMLVGCWIDVDVVACGLLVDVLLVVRWLLFVVSCSLLVVVLVCCLVVCCLSLLCVVVSCCCLLWLCVVC